MLNSLLYSCPCFSLSLLEILEIIANMMAKEKAMRGMVANITPINVDSSC
jgi:hypothetical protein